jgi:hypothetical protein
MNFDYKTNQVTMAAAAAPRKGKKQRSTTQPSLPASLYLRAKPAFFGTGPWPWRDPLGTTTLLGVLPAKARVTNPNPMYVTPPAQ